MKNCFYQLRGDHVDARHESNEKQARGKGTSRPSSLYVALPKPIPKPTHRGVDVSGWAAPPKGPCHTQLPYEERPKIIVPY